MESKLASLTPEEKKLSQAYFVEEGTAQMRPTQARPMTPWLRSSLVRSIALSMGTLRIASSSACFSPTYDENDVSRQ